MRSECSQWGGAPPPCMPFSLVPNTAPQPPCYVPAHPPPTPRYVPPPPPLPPPPTHTHLQHAQAASSLDVRPGQEGGDIATDDAKQSGHVNGVDLNMSGG